VARTRRGARRRSFLTEWTDDDDPADAPRAIPFLPDADARAGAAGGADERTSERAGQAASSGTSCVERDKLPGFQGDRRADGPVRRHRRGGMRRRNEEGRFRHSMLETRHRRIRSATPSEFPAIGGPERRAVHELVAPRRARPFPPPVPPRGSRGAGHAESHAKRRRGTPSRNAVAEEWVVVRARAGRRDTVWRSAGRAQGERTPTPPRRRGGRASSGPSIRASSGPPSTHETGGAATPLGPRGWRGGTRRCEARWGRAFRCRPPQAV
jgi:hypothetical protein